MKKLTKTLLARFNQPDTVMVISKYPYQDIAKSHHGVADYTQHTLTEVAKKTGQKFVVLVAQEYNREIEVVCEHNILLVPAFSESLQTYNQLLS
jgi:hypothetical protein